MKRITAFIVIFIFILTPIARSEEAIPTFDKNAFIESARIKTALEIGMVDCIVMALKNNSEILIKKIAPLIAKDDVKIKDGKFDPALKFDFSMEEDFELSAIPLFSPDPSKTRINIYNAGYDQKLISGTDIGLALNTTRIRSNSLIDVLQPSFDSRAEVTIRQPLLKGFGIAVTTAELRIAKNNKLKSDQDLIKEVIVVLTNVKQAYYDLQYAREQYRVAKTSVDRVTNLLYINKEKYMKGLASNVDVLQSESEVARMERALLASEAELKLAEDKLKLITNLVDDPEFWNAQIVLLDPLDYEKRDIDLIKAILTAFDHRPDYAAAKLDLKNRDIYVVYYRNGVLPTLDLTGSYGFNGLAKNIEKDLGHIGGGHYPDWMMGVKFRMPLGSEKEVGEYRKSKHEKQQALLAFQRLEQDIILQVRTAVRDVDIAYRTVLASKISKEAEEQNYTAQEQRFSAGLVSTLDIVIYQERLAKAEVDYVKSIIDYKMTLIKLSKVQGTTLIEDRIKIE